MISWGAASASDATLRAMGEKFPGALNVAVFGQTETSPITCVLRGEDSLRKLGSVGRPIPGIQCRVVEEEMNDVAVIGRPDPRWGQIPVAFVSLAPQARLPLTELTAFLDGRLASFKRPKDLVALAALPRNAGGKVVKGALRAQDEEAGGWER